MQPFGFFLDFLVKILLFDDFLVDNLFLPFFKIAETFVVAAQNAAVEPEGCPGGVAQKHPVMADEYDRAAKIGDNFFKFFNRRHIQMVGRLVQQQNVRFVNQRLGQRGFFRSPPEDCSGLCSARMSNCSIRMSARYSWPRSCSGRPESTTSRSVA